MDPDCCGADLDFTSSAQSRSHIANHSFCIDFEAGGRSCVTASCSHTSGARSASFNQYHCLSPSSAFASNCVVAISRHRLLARVESFDVSESDVTGTSGSAGVLTAASWG